VGEIQKNVRISHDMTSSKNDDSFFTKTTKKTDRSKQRVKTDKSFETRKGETMSVNDKIERI